MLPVPYINGACGSIIGGGSHAARHAPGETYLCKGGANLTPLPIVSMARCLEACYLQLKGILKVESGYAAGEIKNPSYNQVRACMGELG